MLSTHVNFDIIMKNSKFEKVNQRESNAKRNLIMDAAESIFASKTFNKANIREIAKEVGISPGSIYTYFRDLETLYIETALRGAEKLIKVFKDIADQPNNTIAQAATAYIDFIMNNYEYLRMVQHSMLYGKFNSKESIEKIYQTYRELFEYIDAIISSSVKSDNIRKFSHLFFASLNGILFSYARFPKHTRKEAIIYMRELASMLSEQLEKK